MTLIKKSFFVKKQEGPSPGLIKNPFENFQHSCPSLLVSFSIIFKNRNIEFFSELIGLWIRKTMLVSLQIHDGIVKGQIAC